MGYRILWHGVPLARCDQLERSDDWVAAADLEPLSGYVTVQPIVRAGSAALRNYGFLGPVADPDSLSRGQSALSSAAVLGRELELVREEDGQIIPTEFIDLVDWPSPASPFFAWIAWRQDGAPVPARISPLETPSGNSAQEF